MDEINNLVILLREDDIYSSEMSSYFMVSIKLDGNNYPIWRNFFEMAVSERLKLDFLFGEVPKPDFDTHPKEYRKWKACTDIVRTLMDA